jgi:CheY-like chemotaxis protein
MPQTVLVADGDSTTLELVSAVLTRDGFEVVATPDGGDALSRFLESRPFLVLCAEALPSLRGSELCRQIKAQSPETRVVVLHANAGSIEGLGLAGELDCDALLPVPFKYGDLKKLLIEWCVLGSAADSAEDRGAFSVPATSDHKLELPPRWRCHPTWLHREPSRRRLNRGAFHPCLCPSRCPWWARWRRKSSPRWTSRRSRRRR